MECTDVELGNSPRRTPGKTYTSGVKFLKNSVATRIISKRYFFTRVHISTESRRTSTRDAGTRRSVPTTWSCHMTHSQPVRKQVRNALLTEGEYSSLVKTKYWLLLKQFFKEKIAHWQIAAVFGFTFVPNSSNCFKN